MSQQRENRAGRFRAVGFSRVLGTGDALTLALSVCFAISALISMPLAVELGDADAPSLYLLAFPLYLPLLLALADRSRLATELSSLYHLARVNDSAPRVFFTGWLKLGGYIAVGALLVRGIARSVDTWLVHLLGIEVAALWIAVLVVFLSSLDEIFLRGSLWRIRKVTVSAAVLATVGLISWAFVKQGAGDAVPPKPTLETHDLTVIGLLAAGLWAMDLVLLHRPQLRRPDRSTGRAMVISWALTALAGALIALLLIRHPSLQRANWTGALSWRENRIELLIALSVALLCWTGLARVVSGAARQLSALCRDGFLPRALAPDTSASVLGGRAVAFVAAPILLATLLTPRGHLAAFAAATFLVAVSLVLDPWIRSKRARELSRLPFHPLIPVLGVGLGLFLVVVQRLVDHLVLGLWLALGLVAFQTLSRRASRGRLADAVTLGSDGIDNADEVTVLTAVGPDSKGRTLVTAAAALAEALDTRAVALQIVPIEENTPVGAARLAAEHDWRRLFHLVSEAGGDDRVTPIVRLAPTVGLGVLEAAAEYDVGWVVLAGPSVWNRDRSLGASAAETVFNASSRQLAIVEGEMVAASSVVVGTSGGPHAALALRLGSALAESLAVPLRLVHVRTAKQGSTDPLASTIEAAGVGIEVETRIIEANDVVAGLPEACEDHSVLIVGATVDRVLNQSVYESMARRLAEQRGAPTITVKRSEPRRRFLLRRIWSLLAAPFPTLSISERAEVFTEMRHSARARVDFFILTSLASAIATLGLALDSSAVIIGAMLVAPLMSPILALAHGIVLGNLLMVRRSSASIVQGVGVAVAVSIVFSLFVPSATPTSEILARTQPNLLDLMVALASGAAAAYAVSRKSVAAALPGVAISAALVPPLCVVGFGLAKSEFAVAGGSLLLFVTNLAAIVLVGGIVFMLLGVRPRRGERGSYVRRAIVVAIAAIFLLTIPLAFRTRGIARESRIEARIVDAFRRAVPDQYQLRDLEVRADGEVYEVSVSVYTFEGQLDRSQVEAFRKSIEEIASVPIRLRLSHVAAELLEVGPGLEAPKAEPAEPDPEAFGATGSEPETPGAGAGSEAADSVEPVRENG